MEEVITNQSKFVFEACDDSQDVVSNEVTVQLVDLGCYEVTKTASCGYVFEGGQITFCTTITSTCATRVYDDLTFVDTLAPELQYVDGSFTVNGVATDPAIADNTIEYPVSEDDWEDDEIVICFTVTVNSVS